MPLTGLVAEARKRTVQIQHSIPTPGQMTSVSTVSDSQTAATASSEAKQEVKRMIDFSSEIEQAGRMKQITWVNCRHLKQSGERHFCKRYLSLCAQEKCGTKYLNSEEHPLDYKRLLRSGGK